MSNEKRLARNTFILGIGMLFPRFATLITLPIYTAMLTKAEYGTYDLLNSLVFLVIPIITLQIQQAAFRFLIDCRNSNNEDEKKEIISSVFCFTGITSVVSTIVVYFFLSGVPSINKILICLYFLFEALLETSKHIVRGLGDNKTFTICATLHAIANVIFSLILLLWLNMGLVGMMVSLNSAIVIAFFFIMYRVKIFRYLNINYLRKSLIKKLLVFSTPIVPSTVSFQVVNTAGRWLTTAYMGIEATAIIGIAYRIPGLLSQINAIFDIAWRENASEAHIEKDSDKYFSMIFNTLFNFIAGATALLIAATPIIFPVLIRGDYDDAYYQIPILYLGTLFNSLVTFYGGVYFSTKKTMGVGLSSGLGAVISILVNWILIRHIGLYATSIAMLVSYISIFIYRLIETRKWKKIEYKWMQMILCLLVLIAMCILCYQRLLIFDILNISIAIIFAYVINRSIIHSISRKLLQRIR